MVEGFLLYRVDILTDDLTIRQIIEYEYSQDEKESNGL